MCVLVTDKKTCGIDNGGCMDLCTVVGDGTVDDVCECSPGYTLSDNRESCNVDKGMIFFILLSVKFIYILE